MLELSKFEFGHIVEVNTSKLFNKISLRFIVFGLEIGTKRHVCVNCHDSILHCLIRYERKGT